MLVWVAILLLSHLMCFSPLEKPLFCILDSFSTEYRQIPLLSIFMGLTLTASEQIGRSIEPKSCALCLLDTSSADSRSIEVAFFLINSRNLLDWSRYPLACIVFHIFCIFLLSCHPYHLVSLHSCIYMDSLCPIDHLYVFWVKLYSFLYPLLIMTKRRRKCGFFLSFYMLGGEIHALVRGSCVSSC